MSEFVICLPTYNEKENLKTLLPELLDLFDKNNLDGQVLVIDDSSPDLSAELVNEWNRKDPRIQLLLRSKKEGLGKAYIAGFKEVLKSSSKYIFSMDADHSHNPSNIPEMLKVLKNNNFQIVVGSRKIKDGMTKNWGVHRKFISSAANFYTRILLRLTIHDVTSGYRCYNKNILEMVKLDEIGASGYAFQIEMIYLAERLLNANVTEIPIIFVDRKIGKSKLGFNDILEFGFMILRLFFFGWRRKTKIHNLSNWKS